MSPDLDRFVALDVEIASRSPLSVCAIGVARYERGVETAHYSSCVHYKGRIRYTHIHGLTKIDLHDAPGWPDVWRHVMKLFEGISVVVAYRAGFDRAAVMTMCARHALMMPRIRFLCAATSYTEQRRMSVGLESALREQGIAFPGRPHEPLADARAAAALMLSLFPVGGK